MPLPLTTASGRVIPATVIVFADTMSPSTRVPSTRVPSNGEVPWSFRPAEVGKRERTSVGRGLVEPGMMAKGVAVAGGWFSGMAVGGIGEGVAAEEIAETEVAAGAEEVTASSPAQAAENNNRAARGATTGKGPILIHHRPNTWLLISCFGPGLFRQP